MAQTGYTPILIYASGTTGNTPSAANLTSSASGAELAINYFDGKLFYKDNAGVVQVLATKGTGPIGGSNTQVQYNSSGALAGSANLTFDGTTLSANTVNLTNALGVAYGGTGVTTSTGTGSVVLSNSPALTTPNLGTPSAATLTNATGLPVATGISGLGTGVATALAVNTGTAGAFVVNGGALGTPSTGTLTNATGLPLTTGVTGTLPAANGGTGQSTYTAGDLIYATGATALAKLGIGASTTVLTSSGSAPQWTAASSVAIGTATNLAGGAAGSVPYQSGAATTTFLGIGAANTVMTSSGTAPQWSTALTGLTGVSTTTLSASSTTTLSGLTASTALALDASKNVVSVTNTGTGNNVLSASPTLTGTISAAAVTLSSDLTLNGGTANGVVYLNASKVATSGSALTFDGALLAVGGTATEKITTNGAIRVTGSQTTAGTGTYLSQASTSLGELAHYGPDNSTLGQLRFYLASANGGIGGEQMRLTSTGLGIGTSSPGAKLDVAGSTNGIFASRVFNTNSGSSAYSVLWLGNNTDGNLGGILCTSSTNTAYGGVNSLNLYTGGAYPIGFVTNNTLQMLIDSSGNLGLGVTPVPYNTNARVLQIDGGANQAELRLTNNTTGTSGTNGGLIEQAGNDLYVWNIENSFLSLGTNNTERARITSGGDFRVKGAGTAGSTDAVQFSGSAPASSFIYDSNGYLGIGTTPTTQFYVSGGGVSATRTSTFESTSNITSAPVFITLRRTTTTGSASQAVGQINFIRTLTDATTDTAANIFSYGNNNAGSIDGVLRYTALTRHEFYTDGSATEKARLTSAANFKIGGTANRATTEGTNQLVLFNGTAPSGTLTNGVSIYSASGEAYVMDAAGNATLFSPHDKETNEWIFKSKHTPTGKVLRIDVEKLLRFVNDHFGLDAVQEFIE